MAGMLKNVGGEWVPALCPQLEMKEWCCDDRCVFLMRVSQTEKFICSKSLTMSDEFAERWNVKLNFLKRAEENGL